MPNRLTIATNIAGLRDFVGLRRGLLCISVDARASDVQVG